MKIYLIYKTIPVWYDEYSGFVVAANNRNEAVRTCNKIDADCMLGNIKVTKVGGYTGNKKRAFIILEDFNAA